MSKFRHFYNETYQANFYYIACSPKVYVQKIKDEFGITPKINGQDANFSAYKKNGLDVGVIWLTDGKHLDWLVHECLHTVHWALLARGLWLTDASEEAYAYLIEWLFNQIVGRKRK